MLGHVWSGYSSPVSTHREKSQQIRTSVRRALLALGLALGGLALVPTMALADTPSTAPDAPTVSGFEYLLVLVLIPAGLFAVVTLFAALPSMIRDKGYEQGQSWRSEPEWFGGPRKGVEAADETKAIETGESGRGGTSGTW